VKSRGLVEPQALRFNESFERPSLSAETLPALRAAGRACPQLFPLPIWWVDISNGNAHSSADAAAIRLVIYFSTKDVGK
jgi:hypothetical protein